jgi:2-C-methyl-D-erythritol 4-phosphate cytidylyltransferase
MATNSALLLAAGSGSRMLGSVADKVLAPLAGEPAICHSVRAFIESGICDQLTLVYRDEAQRHQLQDALASIQFNYTWTLGGAERQESVYNGLLAQSADCNYIFIHDCARPLVSVESLRALYESVKEHSAAVLAHPVKDTIKRVAANHRMAPCELEDLDRARLWAMETPQAFAYNKILEAYKAVAAQQLQVTDDAAAAACIGLNCSIVANPQPNPKITTAADLSYINWLMEQR